MKKKILIIEDEKELVSGLKLNLDFEGYNVIWALDGRFPSIHSFYKEAELEEELRLMYVAATRAKTNLFFTFPGQAYDRGTGTVLTRPSRFLDFIPEHILEKQYIAY